MGSGSAIFFDIDGTIIDGEGNIPDSAINAIRRARSLGTYCLVNTGRPFSHIDPKVKAIGFDGYICSCGQHIVINGETLCHAQFLPERCREIADMVHRCRLDAVYEAELSCRFYLCHTPLESIAYMQRQMSRYGFDIQAGDEDADFGFDKFCVFAHEDSDIESFLSFTAGDCTQIARENNLFEMIKRGYSKERGLEQAVRILKIDKDNCYAIGDSANDLPMLACAAHSIAMGNAPEEIKSAVEYVTEPIRENGLANALAHFGLV